MSFWDFFWLMIWCYVFVAYLILLFHIVVDVFRDPELGGGAKALWIIGLIVVLLFGAKRLPELARSMGQSLREFSKGKDGPPKDNDDDHRATRG